jgi:hypothetical protein
MTLDEFIDWARRHREPAIKNVEDRLVHYPVLIHRHQPGQSIARELALGGVKAALEVARHHCRMPQLLEPNQRSVTWLGEESYRQALRLLPEHAFVGPFLEALGAEEYRLLCWLYVDQFNDRQVARLLGIAAREARRRGWQAYQNLCNRLLQGGWGSDDAAFPLYPEEFGRSGLGL